MADIMFSVCMCARFQAAPRECHLAAVKRILRYLKYSPNIGLWYPKGAHFDLVGFSDSDYAGCEVDSVTSLKFPSQIHLLKIIFRTYCKIYLLSPTP